jgi:hypothetical protein
MLLLRQFVVDLKLSLPNINSCALLCLILFSSQHLVGRHGQRLNRPFHFPLMTREKNQRGLGLEQGT